MMENILSVGGGLEERVSSSDYPITLKIYVDGNELAKAWDDVVLTVKK